MKCVFLVEIDVPEDETDKKDWLKQLIPTADIRHLRYKSFYHYDDEMENDYWRW